ncbi:alpha-1,6-glucosidase domain-containing protein [Pleionea litopenaei]|uniref:pullulanase n=1 Tax=Pleionea litopenaei TaxID=3070815 RepID=A0AA51X6L2_9GAMM|nr:alpha-1,6-glucosidase domain-containing protein [Pleionea sp. HL-JVS1]WMS86951.1 DUF3372 domain-containing protein [Pleionea sp. HL-JVS1]
MMSFKKFTLTISLVLTLLGLTACDNKLAGEVLSGNELLSCDLPLIPNASGTACVAPPPLECAPPLVPNDTNTECVIGLDPNAPAPTVFPSATQAILFYNRGDIDANNSPGDPVYDGYRLHTWNNEECDAYQPSSIAQSWQNGLTIDGIDPNYGAYWILDLKDGYSDCGNFIIHIGTDDAGKELGGTDKKMNLVQDDPDFVRMNWTFSGNPTIFEYPVVSLGQAALKVEDAAAHWLDSNTLVWGHGSSEIATVKLHYSLNELVEADEDGNVSGTVLELSDTTLTPEQAEIHPLVNSWPAYSGTWSEQDAKGVLKGHVVAVGYDASGTAIKATNVQTAKVLDALYTQGTDDANEATLGVQYTANGIEVSVWAPTAQSVNLNIYRDDGVREQRLAMTEDSATGIWHYTAPMSLDRRFYRFELSLFHYASNKFETITATDPYSVGLAMNGDYSQFVDLTDSDLYPDGWEGHSVPTIADPEDAVIYEMHLRDFSAREATVTSANRGKFMAFTETSSAPVQHLSDLAAAGLTHIHLLPVNDIATINEFENLVVDLDDTVGDLCRVNASAPVCGSVSDSTILGDLLESYGPLEEQQQALVQAMRNTDSFNWGYDPKHFNVPDGIYATDPNGVARIKEFREMVKSVHDLGLRVVIDVVYNHTNSAGTFDNSVFDKVVPGYYHRRDIESGSVTQSTCCNDTELYNVMMDKFMKDSLLQWTTQYGVDGYRFDIMSHGSKQQMLEARDLVQAVDPDSYFYGEGWYRGDGYDDTAANQQNMAGTEIATFNDRLRDGVRYADLFKADGNPGAQDIVKLGLAGQLANYVLVSSNGVASTGSSFNPASYALDPADVINYVSKHDNETLWDMLQFQLPLETPLADRVRIANISAAVPLMSQGIPFLQLGGDMLRSKSLDKNSYDAGDWFNTVDYTMNSNNWAVGLPLAQDNGYRWYGQPGQSDLSISELLSSSNTRAYAADIQQAHSVFKEFLTIRRDSKLFRLTTEQDVLDRVGFHNLGRNQTHGVIVMSIDDGIGLADLDPNVDAMVVVLNGTGNDIQHTVPTASGFELHPVQVASVDANVAAASFTAGVDEGTFNVPALTMAVFVKPQAGAQGEGLSAYATAGAPDVVPYGDTVAYIRGDMNGWSTDDPVTYQGNGIYRTSITLTGGQAYSFKFASEDWSTVNFGAQSAAEAAVTVDTDKTLYRTNDNLSITVPTTGSYFFEIDASDPEAPVLHVRNTDVFAGTSIYVRGGINGWGTASELVHQGDGIYKVIVDVGANTGAQEFKIASADWATVDISYGDGSAQVTEDEVKLLGPGAGLANMTMDFAVSGEYTFILDASDRDLRYLSVHQTQMYGSETIYLRGVVTWDPVDVLAYQGDSTYSIDIALAAGTYNFKFADANWGAINFGLNGDDNVMTLGEPKTLIYNAGDITIDLPAAGTYRFEVKGPNENQPSMTIIQL